VSIVDKLFMLKNNYVIIKGKDPESITLHPDDFKEFIDYFEDEVRYQSPNLFTCYMFAGIPLYKNTIVERL